MLPCFGLLWSIALLVASVDLVFTRLSLDEGVKPAEYGYAFASQFDLILYPMTNSSWPFALFSSADFSFSF